MIAFNTLAVTELEIVEVHRGLTQQAFRQQAEGILADGQLTKARIEQLNEVQKQVCLPPECAQKVIKSITTTEMAAAIETTLSTGGIDEEEVYEKIPADLNINADKAIEVVCELARSRLSFALIQAVALLRQRNRPGVVSSLNDLLACHKAVPAEQLSWEVPEELADLFAIYSKSEPAPEKLSRLQHLLGVSDSAAAAIREMGDRVIQIGAEEEEFDFWSTSGGELVIGLLREAGNGGSQSLMRLWLRKASCTPQPTSRERNGAMPSTHPRRAKAQTVKVLH
ncbi:hypothetical protein NL676_032912 [Syzygium grande]|nr:hypothetical protein NL676_032912 [Syzygium grande]